MATQVYDEDTGETVPHLDGDKFKLGKPATSRWAKWWQRHFPKTESWGYYPRRINGDWLFGKVEQKDRVIFAKFVTLWIKGDFAWGLFKPHNEGNFIKLVQALMNDAYYDPKEDRNLVEGVAYSLDDEIDKLHEHLKSRSMSSPFESYGESDREVLLEAVAARKDYQEDTFPIEFGWAPPKPAVLKRRLVRQRNHLDHMKALRQRLGAAGKATT